MYFRKTDLALEIHESFSGNGGEIPGVSLEKEKIDLSICGEKIDISTVRVLNKIGSEKMGKQIGSYITIEAGKMDDMYEEDEEKLTDQICRKILDLINKKTGKIKYLIAGLGNKDITSDSLGPYVVDNLAISGHYVREFGDSFLEMISMHEVCAIAPGVMAQTGMEAEEIIESLIRKTNPDVLLVVDALATSSLKRLVSTVQISDTGIDPGSGVGNHRIGLNEKNLGLKVISIGVPTVVEAEVIVNDRIEELMKNHGFKDEETNAVLSGIKSRHDMRKMYVTTKNIDESIMKMGDIISNAINKVTKKGEYQFNDKVHQTGK